MTVLRRVVEPLPIWLTFHFQISLSILRFDFCVLKQSRSGFWFLSQTALFAVLLAEFVRAARGACSIAPPFPQLLAPNFLSFNSYRLIFIEALLFPLVKFTLFVIVLKINYPEFHLFGRVFQSFLLLIFAINTRRGNRLLISLSLIFDFLILLANFNFFNLIHRLILIAPRKRIIFALNFPLNSQFLLFTPLNAFLWYQVAQKLLNINFSRSPTTTQALKFFNPSNFQPL